MEELQGGRKGQIFRSNTMIYRPRGKWSETIHCLLLHIAKRGFHAAPQPYGFDGKGMKCCLISPVMFSIVR